MALVAAWRREGMLANLRDEEDDLWATLKLVDDWYSAEREEPERAWVVEWLARGGDEPSMARTRLEATPEPALTEQIRSRLSEAAAEAARSAAPAEPEPFGHAETAYVRGGDVRKRVELISLATQQSQGRLETAARSTEPWGGQGVLIALTELVGWVRALDDVMGHAWRHLPDDRREALTAQIDTALNQLSRDPAFVTWARSQRGADEYSDWTLGLLLRSTGSPREDLRGIRWLAGKLLHFGPLPAVELRQWREGEAPRWKWRGADEIFPAKRGERRSHDREAYDRNLAGRDLIGTFNLFDALLATEFLALDLSGNSAS